MRELHDPITDPRLGDIVRSEHPSIGERHVLHVSDCGVKYWRVRPNGKRNEGYCFRRTWTKWCRDHRVTVEQRG